MIPLPHSASSSFAHHEFLRPGHNCWRIERAHRYSLLIDADNYFKAVRAAITQAQHSIFILSWDIDSRMQLVPSGANDGYPESLGDFLHTIVAERPHLHAYVLNWDFAMLYALEREWLPVYKMGWRTHRRLSFCMDGHHPMGASHHQKVVVIDDAIAFVGGLDLTRCRWDTSEHACNEPRRCDANGKPYAPFHDVQAMVDGEIAGALGELCRTRWQQATGHYPPKSEVSRKDLWPAGIVPDLTDVNVGLSRTMPPFAQRPGIFEIKQLHLDAIRFAKKYLFFENQYFTSDLIGKALSARLNQPDGPEILVVSPQAQSGWLEESTMGVLRARVHRRLKAEDRYQRYRLCCPYLPDLASGCLNVHSKVFSVDDAVLCVGSANLSTRSMAFDTECCLTIEAAGSDSERARIADAIARMRARLVGEHVAAVPETVMAATRRLHSLHAAIDTLTQPGRSLRPFDPVTTPELDALIPDPAPFDPEKPIDPDELVAQFVPPEAHRPAPRRLIALGTLAIGLALLAIAWRWTPLRDWVNLASLITLARNLENMPMTPAAVLGLYAVAGLVVPITLLIAATGIVFGPLWGSCYAIAGALLSASVSYALGEWLGRDTVRRLLGARINKLSQRIAKRGVLTVIIVRLLPVAPFTVINVVAGASHLRFRDFVAGTVLGMSPGIVLTVTFIHNLAEAARRPSMGAVATLFAVVLLLIAMALGLRRLFAGKAGMEVQ